MQLVIHAPFGARINKAWGLALRKRFCRRFNFELQAAATDNGMNISLAEQHSFPLADVFQFLTENTVKEVLDRRRCSLRCLKRAGAGMRTGAGAAAFSERQESSAADSAHALRRSAGSVFPDAAACQENIDGRIEIPDHPLVREVMKDVLQEAMDLEGLKDVLREIDRGEHRCIAVDTPVPSQFSHEILNAIPMLIWTMRRWRSVARAPWRCAGRCRSQCWQEVGALDPAAIAEVSAEAWPDVRDADELARRLHTLVAVPENFVPPGRRQVRSMARLLTSVSVNSTDPWRRVFEPGLAGARRVATWGRAQTPSAASALLGLCRESERLHRSILKLNSKVVPDVEGEAPSQTMPRCHRHRLDHASGSHQRHGSCWIAASAGL